MVEIKSMVVIFFNHPCWYYVDLSAFFSFNKKTMGLICDVISLKVI